VKRAQVVRGAGEVRGLKVSNEEKMKAAANVGEKRAARSVIGSKRRGEQFSKF